MAVLSQGTGVCVCVCVCFGFRMVLGFFLYVLLAHKTAPGSKKGKNLGLGVCSCGGFCGHTGVAFRPSVRYSACYLGFVPLSLCGCHVTSYGARMASIMSISWILFKGSLSHHLSFEPSGGVAARPSD